MYSNQEFSRRFRIALAELAKTPQLLGFDNGVHEDRGGGLRLSGIGDCARRQYFKVVLADTFAAVEAEADGATYWAPWMGYAGQAIVAAVLTQMGYGIGAGEEQVVYGGIPGHIDGLMQGLDLGWKSVWDNKVRGPYMYRQLATIGLPQADPQMYYQMQGYMGGTGSNLAIITIVPHDFSENRNQIERYIKEEPRPDPLVTRLVVKRDMIAQKRLQERGAMLRIAIANRQLVAREFDPEKDRFPCPYCEFLKICTLRGQTDDFVVPPVIWNEDLDVT